jgi:hypothetical protein
MQGVTIIGIQAVFFAIGVTVLLICSKCCGDRGSPTVDERVAILIEKTLKSSTEAQTFAVLEALGCSFVPAIIERTDDKRKLPRPGKQQLN